MISVGLSHGRHEYIYHDAEGVPRGWLYLEPDGQLNVAVDPNHQRQGIATALVERVLQDHRIDIRAQAYTMRGDFMTTKIISDLKDTEISRKHGYTCEELNQHRADCSCPDAS